MGGGVAVPISNHSAGWGVGGQRQPPTPTAALHPRKIAVTCCTRGFVGPGDGRDGCEVEKIFCLHGSSNLERQSPW